MTREMIINELQERGIQAEANDVTKNGVVFQGITVGDGTVRPMVYAEWYQDYAEENMEDVIDEIMYQVKKAMDNMDNFDLEHVCEWDSVKTKLQLCIQRKGNEDIVKRDFLDLEEYVRVNLGNNGSFKVKPDYLEYYGITEDMLFQAAWDNTASSIEIKDMAQVLADMGIPAQFMEDLMIVASNKEKCFGAIAMKSTDKLLEVADRYETDLAILPSSIHEIFLVPVSDVTNSENLNAMIQKVNSTGLAPEDVLSNHAYVFSRETRSIQVM